MQMTRRFLSMILAVAMICGMLTGITISASAVSVSGSFVKYTAEADGTIAEGDYLVVYNGKAMKAAVVSGRLSYAEVTAENDAIANPDEALVWHIAASDTYYTLYNASTKSYAAGTGVKNKAQLLADGTSDNALWTGSGTDAFEFVNKANAAKKVNATLRGNGTYGFACYAASTGGALTLYKLDASAAVCGHTNVEQVAAVAATCTTDGSEAGTKCTDCGAILSGCATVPALGHAWNEGEVTTAATCTTDGVKTFTCTRCAETKVEPVPATGHTYENGVCTVCGEAEPAKTSYVLVSDASTLKAGDVIVIASASKGAAAAAMGGKTYFAQTVATAETGAITASDAIEITLGGEAGAWTLTTAEGVVGTSAVKVLELNNASGAQTWTIEIDAATGAATIASTNASCGKILYNVSATRFTNYTTAPNAGMVLPEIYRKGDAAPCGHTNVVEVEAVAATCTADGCEAGTKCADCGKVLTGCAVIPALGHDYGEYTVTKEATCTEAGEQTRTCSRCNAVDTVVVPALGHVDADQDSKCDRCGAEMALDLYTLTDTLTAGSVYVIAAKDADGKYWALSNFETGKAVTTCTEVSFANNAVNTPDATVLFKAVEGTYTPYTGIGFEGATEGNYLHLNAKAIRVTTSFQNGIFTVAAGTEPGSVSLKSCNEKYLSFANGKFTVSASAADLYLFAKAPAAHVHTLTAVEAKAATCTEAGNEAYWTCTCGKLFSDAEGVTELTEIPTIPALGHDLHSTVFPATCTEEGYTHVTCSRCDYSDMTDIVEALGHDYVRVVTPATCTEDGYTTVTCKRCDYSDLTDIVTAKGHSNYQYADNGDGTHKVTCGVCAAVIDAAEAHVYVDGVCACGVSEKLTDANLKFFGKTVIFEADFSIKYYVPKAVVDTYDSVYVSVTKSVYDADGNVTGKKTTKVDVTDYNSGYNAYGFKFAGIAAAEVGSNVDATVYGVKDGKTYEGATQSGYSVKQYCYNTLSKANTTAANKRVLVDFLNYASAAQVYFNINTKNLVNAELTDEQKAFGTATVAAIGNDRADGTVANATVAVSGCTLIFEGKIMMKFVFDPATYLNNGGSLSDLSVVVKDAEGKVLKTFAAADFEDYGTRKSVVFDRLASTDMRKAVTFQVMVGDTAVSNSRTYSIQTYAYSKQNDAAQGTLVQEMIKYGDSMVAWKIG